MVLEYKSTQPTKSHSSKWEKNKKKRNKLEKKGDEKCAARNKRQIQIKLLPLPVTKLIALLPSSKPTRYKQKTVLSVA